MPVITLRSLHKLVLSLEDLDEVGTVICSFRPTWSELQGQQ